MAVYEPSDVVIQEWEGDPYLFTCGGSWNECWRLRIPAGINSSNLKFKFELKWINADSLWPIFIFRSWIMDSCTPVTIYPDDSFGQPAIPHHTEWQNHECTLRNVSAGQLICFNAWDFAYPQHPGVGVRKIQLCGSPVGISPGVCIIFQWIGGAFAAVGGYFHTVADVFREVWYIGPPIADVFDSIGTTLDAVDGWFNSIFEWCLGVVTTDWLGASWAWLQSLYTDAYGTITGVLGDTWTWLVGLRNDFTGAVTAALGTTWSNLVNLYNNFSSRVTAALGGTWTWVVGLYNDFTGAVTGALGDTWTWLKELYANAYDTITGALGDTWTWVVGLYNNFAGAVIAALGEKWEWLAEFAADPMWKIGAELEEKIKSMLDWMIQEAFKIIDTSWSTFENSFKWLTTKMLSVIGDAAEDFKDAIWDTVEKVMKKL